jgi:hypothetical protein
MQPWCERSYLFKFAPAFGLWAVVVVVAVAPLPALTPASATQDPKPSQDPPHPPLLTNLARQTSRLPRFFNLRPGGRASPFSSCLDLHTLVAQPNLCFSHHRFLLIGTRQHSKLHRHIPCHSLLQVCLCCIQRPQAFRLPTRNLATVVIGSDIPTADTLQLYHNPHARDRTHRLYIRPYCPSASIAPILLSSAQDSSKQTRTSRVPSFKFGCGVSSETSPIA